MSDFELIIWGIITISIVGLIGCIISAIGEWRLLNLRLKLAAEEYQLRARAQVAAFIEFSKLLKNKK